MAFIYPPQSLRDLIVWASNLILDCPRGCIRTGRNFPLPSRQAVNGQPIKMSNRLTRILHRAVSVSVSDEISIRFVVDA